MIRFRMTSAPGFRLLERLDGFALERRQRGQRALQRIRQRLLLIEFDSAADL